MKKKLEELLEKRAKIHEDQKALLDKVDGEKRAMTSEETETYEKMDADFEAADKEIEALRAEMKAQEERRQKSAKRDEIMKRSIREPIKDDPADKPGAPAPPDHRDSPRDTPEYRNAFNRYLRTGAVSPELRALQVDDDPQAGYILPPMQFVNEVIRKVNDAVNMRRYCRVWPVTGGGSLGAAAVDTKMGDPTWTVELGVGNADTTLALGARELAPHPLARYIKVSNTLIKRTVGGIDTLVRDELGRVFGEVEEYAFINGTGQGQPLGIMTASAMGINTGQDVSTGNSSSTIGADNLIECFYTLKPGHQQNATWMFHRSIIKLIRKLKDGEGNYMWERSYTAGEPDTILSRPVVMSEFMPYTLTSGAYIGIIGNFDYYWIADAYNLAIQVLMELFALTNQVAYLGRLEVDAMPVLEEAFVRSALA